MLQRVEIVAYVAAEDCDSDIDRSIDFLREVLDPELVIVSKSDITDEQLAAIMQQAEDSDGVVVAD